ncbi:hypothetical protein SRDD_17710 [Serratia sp. DD3]|nr:hypothetical protein SRDD_46020 [Serratia sp. DD3]KEY56777.1 hypothetical protein SRDD_43660 [Serratia sp. DD3]KEY58290.1 hypothetical protein SRDD_25360 [Serratia sp. DD3]KEY59488.1 hypothetical protein SRDD_17710 [Serratia sp. DD3]
MRLTTRREDDRRLNRNIKRRDCNNCTALSQFTSRPFHLSGRSFAACHLKLMGVVYLVVSQVKHGLGP